MDHSTYKYTLKGDTTAEIVDHIIVFKNLIIEGEPGQVIL